MLEGGVQCLAQGEVGCKREKKPVGHFNHPPSPFSALFNGLFPIFSILFFLIVMPLKSLCVKILKVASVHLLKYSRLDNLTSCSILLFQPLNLNCISFKTFFYYQFTQLGWLQHQTIIYGTGTSHNDKPKSKSKMCELLGLFFHYQFDKLLIYN